MVRLAVDQRRVDICLLQHVSLAVCVVPASHLQPASEACARVADKHQQRCTYLDHIFMSEDQENCTERLKRYSNKKTNL